ncbi:hypothetical protein J4218_03405 [Candidatus Pacearchaeota archaeon]|nr:hypothetical protein [Candidatus Pacearchaeota archaeon]
MKNPIRSIDDALTSEANAAVHTWNFTTGRTRSDLSTLLMAVGSSVLIANSIANSMAYPNNLPELVIPVYSAWTAGKAILDPRIEKQEVAAADRQMKDFNVESYKIGQKICGYAVGYIAASILFLSTQDSNPDTSQSSLLKSIGDGLIAASLLITSADSLPPKKNILSRAYDKLNDLIKSYIR